MKMQQKNLGNDENTSNEDNTDNAKKEK